MHCMHACAVCNLKNSPAAQRAAAARVSAFVCRTINGTGSEAGAEDDDIRAASVAEGISEEVALTAAPPRNGCRQRATLPLLRNI